MSSVRHEHNWQFALLERLTAFSFASHWVCRCGAVDTRYSSEQAGDEAL